MNVIEKFICGKKNDPALCEDIIVTTPDFMAVIDGATSKSCPPLGGMTTKRRHTFSGSSIFHTVTQKLVLHNAMKR